VSERIEVVDRQDTPPTNGAPSLEGAESLAAYARELDALNDQEHGWGTFLKPWMTLAVVTMEQRRARRLVHSAGPLRLHLGCADNYLPGWLNIDLARPGRKLDLRWDLRRPVPLPAGSVQAIFAEHLLEHLTLGQALGVVEECRRLLDRGGVLHIGVPDLDRYVRSCQGDDPLLAEVRPGRPTPAVAFCEVFYRYGHRSMYDFDTLQVLCLETGFDEVHRSAFGEGRILPCPDTPARQPETLYVEAVA
jgi:hypothetical protein